MIHFIVGYLLVQNYCCATGIVTPCSSDWFQATEKNLWVFFTHKEGSESAQTSISQPALLRRSKRALESDASQAKRFAEYSAAFAAEDQAVSRRFIERVLRIEGVKLRIASAWLNAITVRVSIPSAVSAISQLPFVARVSCVAESRQALSVEHEQQLPDESDDDKRRSHLHTDGIDYGRSEKVHDFINARAAHAAGFTGKGVTVLVLDSGFTFHETIDRSRIKAEKDFVDSDNISYDENAAQGSHGTSTLGLIAGNLPGIYVGIAFDCDIMLGRTEQASSETKVEEDNYVAAIEWGEKQGADMISSSLGYHLWWNFKDYNGDTSELSRACYMAYKRGLVIVTSAGNYGDAHMAVPGDSEGTLSVGAVTWAQRMASFSSTGPTSDGRIKPDVSTVGDGVYCASAGGGYSNKQGTSFSAPIVAGAVALILQAHPDWKPFQVFEAVRQTATNAKAPRRDIGWGVVNALSAIEYKQKQPCDGNCQDRGQCDSGTGMCGSCTGESYGPYCQYERLACESYCGDESSHASLCFENRCYCRNIPVQPAQAANMKCIARVIPGWTCLNSNYGDGKICHLNCSLPDPDCAGFLCPSLNVTSLPIDNLANFCAVVAVEVPRSSSSSLPHSRDRSRASAVQQREILLTMATIFFLAMLGLIIAVKRVRDRRSKVSVV